MDAADGPGRCRTFGRLDVLVGETEAIADFGPVESADPALWDDVIRTNVLGVLYAVRATMPHLAVQGSGHIVIVSSASGRETYVGEPAYIASKHTRLFALANSLRKEVAPRGIAVTVIEPGLVETPLSEGGTPRRTPLRARRRPPGFQPRSPRSSGWPSSDPAGVDLYEVVVRPTSQDSS